MTITSLLPPPPRPSPESILFAAKSAREVYAAAVNSAFITRDGWLRISAALDDSADALEQLLSVGGVPDGVILTAGMIECQRDRARDAERLAQRETSRSLQWIPTIRTAVYS